MRAYERRGTDDVDLCVCGGREARHADSGLGWAVGMCVEVRGQYRASRPFSLRMSLDGRVDRQPGT
jgi:hypothetical protein